MALLKFLLTVISATVASSFTDWFFMGILFHEKYKLTPEVWRSSNDDTETGAIIWSLIMNFVSFFFFVIIAKTLSINGLQNLFYLSLFSWLVGTLPVLITNALFVKLHPLVVVSNALGWLVKFCLIAAAFEIFLGQ